MGIDVGKALNDRDYRESVANLPDPDVTLLKRAGLYDYDDLETADAYDWTGSVVGSTITAERRSAIPRDEMLPWQELQQLMQHGAAGRLLIAQHEATPMPVLVTLVGDRDHRVQLALVRLQPLHAGLIGSPFPAVREAIAQHPHLAQALHARLANDPSERVRLALCERADVDGQLLAALHASDPRLHHAIARNPNTPTPTLALLARSESSRVRDAVARRPRRSV